MVDVAISSESSNRKKEVEKLRGKHEGLKGELERMCIVKASVILVIGALGAVTPKLGERQKELHLSPEEHSPRNS